MHVSDFGGWWRGGGGWLACVLVCLFTWLIRKGNTLSMNVNLSVDFAAEAGSLSRKIGSIQGQNTSLNSACPSPKHLNLKL